MICVKSRSILYRISVKQEATPDGVSAELQIRTVDATDSGPYFCRATNLYGNDQQLVQLQVQEPPQPPSVLEAAMISSRSVNLKWQPKALNSGDVSKYIVEYREADRKLHSKLFYPFTHFTLSSSCALHRSVAALGDQGSTQLQCFD